MLTPAANRLHLMLCDEVVAAASAGLLPIWAALEVDEALGLLTGVPAGAPDQVGEYSEGSLHWAVADRRARYDEALKALTADE